MRLAHCITVAITLSAMTLCPIVLCPNSANGQEDSDPWLGRKAKVFKPITDEQQASIVAAIPSTASAEPLKPRRVLVFFRCETFIHAAIPWGNLAFEEMGKKTGAYEVDFAETYDVFTNDNLAKYDAILLNSTTTMQFPKPAQMNAFLDFIAGGKGLIGIHGAADNFNNHPDCRDIVGGIFGGHPWNAGGTWAFKLNDPDHVLNQAFGGKGFWHTDEIYQYKPESYVGTGVLRVLVSLDMNQKAVSSLIKDGPREVPVSWLREAGDGRVFYTNFGHRNDTYTNSMILRHMLDGIQYALGDLPADATPTDQVTPREFALAPDKP